MNPLLHFISCSHLNPVWGSPDVPVAILSDPLTWLLSSRTIPTSLVWYPVLHSAPASWAQWHWLSCFWLIAWGYHDSVYRVLDLSTVHCTLEKWFLKSGSWTSSSWEYVRSVTYTAAPRTADSEVLGVGWSCPAISVLMDFQIILMMLKFKNDRYRKFT